MKFGYSRAESHLPDGPILRPTGVCLVAEEYPDETGWGGIGTYHYNVARAYRQLGCKVIVICRSLGQARSYWDDGILIKRIRPYFSWNSFLQDTVGYRLAVLVSLARATHGHVVDVIESPEWKAETALFRICFKHPLLCIRMQGNIWLIAKYNAMGSLSVAQRIQGILERYILNTADYVSSCSSAFASWTRNSQITSRDIKVIPNPTDVERFRPRLPKSESYTENNATGLITLLFVGRIEQRKGVHLIFEIIPRLADTVPDLRFVFVGADTPTGSRGQSLKMELTAKLPQKYHRTLDFRGYVRYEEISEQYQGADICVFPSLYEPFGEVCLEAMACGKPVIASRQGGMGELIEDMQSGILFDPLVPGDLLEKVSIVLSDAALRQQIGVRARERVLQLYSQPVVGAQLLDAYGRLLARETSRYETQEPQPP
jgi:glycogen(starch) synthase